MQELDEDQIIETSKTMKKINYVLGWIFVRPRRWFFRNMLYGSFGIRWWFEKVWSVGTMDGTDHRFRGITICPKCGYKQDYEDGSL